MRTASPWWASLTFGVGLLFVFVGERLFGYSSGVRLVLTGLGLVLTLGITGLRAYTMLATRGARRNVERTLLMSQLGVLFGLLLYMFSTNWGVSHFHLSDKGAMHFGMAMTVLFACVITISLIPMFMIELSLGTALRTEIDLGSASDEGIEYLRVRDVGWSGLSVGLAMALLMVTCNVANDRNLEKDVSYFKTSTPGDSTKAIVEAQTEPIRVLLFFPPANDVAHQVRDYFSALASASGHMTIEEHDRLEDAELAGKYKVSKDGEVVLVKGTGDKEKSQTIDIDPDLDKARKTKLRSLDREVNSALLKLIREKRKLYLTVGHGEINDYDSVPADQKVTVPERHTTVLKAMIPKLNYEVKTLGFSDLVKDVPEDATIVMMLAPTISLQPAEWESLSRYLDKGGRLMLVLDPKASPDLGPLEQKLGVKYNPAPLTDDQKFYPQHRGNVDHRFVITTQYSAHASTTSLSRAAKGLLLIESGALEDSPTTGTAPKKTVTIHSMDSSFLDLNNNFEFDASAGEKRQKYNIAEAIEGPKMKGSDGKDKDGWRVLVFADADLFADAVAHDAMGRAGLLMVAELGGGELFDDSVKWLGGEEVFAGAVETEEDKPIQHTKNQDVVWFTLTIIGVPLLVLTLGLVGTLTRRRRKSTAEVKP